jgi:hypothetical protein
MSLVTRHFPHEFLRVNNFSQIILEISLTRFPQTGFMGFSPPDPNASQPSSILFLPARRNLPVQTAPFSFGQTGFAALSPPADLCPLSSDLLLFRVNGLRLRMGKFPLLAAGTKRFRLRQNGIFSPKQRRAPGF